MVHRSLTMDRSYGLRGATMRPGMDYPMHCDVQTIACREVVAAAFIVFSGVRFSTPECRVAKRPRH